MTFFVIDQFSCTPPAVSDADSTGAVAGQMAGALYGYSGIKAGPAGTQVCLAFLPENPVMALR